MHYYPLLGTARLTRQQNRRSTNSMCRAGRGTSVGQARLFSATTLPGSAVALPSVARQVQVATVSKLRKEEVDGH